MQRNYAIDFFKFFAIVAVVLIHTFPSDHKLGFFYIDNFTRFAVPYFFAASGYLFGIKVKDNPNSWTYFKRYIFKILKIYVCWLLFYLAYDMVRMYLEHGDQFREEWDKYRENLTFENLAYYGEGTSGYQLWFVIALVWSVVILYVFFRLRLIGLLLALSLCLNLAGLFGQSYAHFYELPAESTRDALYVGLFYTTLGFSFAYWQKSWNFSRWTYFVWFAVFAVLQGAEGYWLEKTLSAEHGEYFLSTVFLTVFLFIFTIKSPHLGKGLWISKIGARSLGIYTIHVFFIDIVDLWFDDLGEGGVTHSVFWNLIDAFLVFTVSYLVYGLLQRMKKYVWREMGSH
ncbi:acyltransferase [Neobacillus dielmonensis]|uniref:acyltransferase n=1 Tax=Neobacillus dielmonensis TaxID=1347369 RepID=UPI0006938251|nr:acyltransferase [Neobacillus dielmonensis]